MSTTRDMIKAWLHQSREAGATHMLVVCDTYDHEDYPVDVMPGQDVKAVYAANNGPNMTRCMEVYSHTMNHDTQLNEHRARNF